MKHIFIICFTLFLSACFQADAPAEISAKSVIDIKPASEGLQANIAGNDALVKAYQNKQSQVWLAGSGIVKKLLVDDNKGARHQKFLVTINAEQTLLFAHNIDLAPRIDDLQVGDSIEFIGEYVYNPKGGVMHWTHHDPKGEKQGGWIKHNGKKYE
jgi:Protein of unknown function (DUF3465)